MGGNETLVATILPADATNQKVTWASSDEAVATVDANGKVTAVKAGEATITVTTEDGGKTAFCRVTVSDKEVKVTQGNWYHAGGFGHLCGREQGHHGHRQAR